MRQRENLEIIGFDLGHGETAISKTMLFSNSEPQAIDIGGKTSIITAVGTINGRTVIGEDAYMSRDTKDLSILFKDYEFEKPEVREPIQKFVRRCLEILREQHKIAGDQFTYFFVGAPSNWNAEQKKSYETLLRKSGMSNIFVRPESRAAFLDAKESGELSETFSKLSDLVLIIDIGSSTTDFTFVENYQESPLDFGNNKLGGGLLDELIFTSTLESYSEQEKLRIQNLFSEKPELKSMCKLKCRTVKEKYFSKSDEEDWIKTPSEEVCKLDRGLFFEINIYKKDMDKLLNQEIEKLNRKSWKNAFYDELVQCRLSTQKYPKLILMTGGGSRMSFTKAICQEVFPDIDIRVGLEPNLTISKGLARLGKTDFKIQSFRSDVDDLINSERLPLMLREEIPKLLDNLSNTAIENCIRISRKNFEQWVDGNINTLSEMEEKIKSEVSFIFENESDLVFKIDIENWLLSISRRIEMVTYGICDEYKISRTTFNLCMDSSVLLSAEEIGVSAKPSEMISSIGKVVLGIVATIGVIILAMSAFGATVGIGVALSVNPRIRDKVFNSTMLSWSSDKFSDLVRNLNFPKNLRSILMSETELKRAIEKQRDEFKGAVKEQLEISFSDQERINEIFLPIRDALYKRADEAAVLIE